MDDHSGRMLRAAHTAVLTMLCALQTTANAVSPPILVVESEDAVNVMTGAAQWTSVRAVGVRSNGQALMTGILTGPGLTTSNNRAGGFMGAAPFQLLYQTGVPMPGQSTVDQSEIQEFVWTSPAGQVVAGRGVRRIGAVGQFERVVTSSMIIPELGTHPSLPIPARLPSITFEGNRTIADSGQFYFASPVVANWLPTDQRSVILGGTASTGMHMVMQSGGLIPGSATKRFTSFGGAVPIDGGGYWFSAGLAAGATQTSSQWRRASDSAVPELLLETGTPAPGVPGGKLMSNISNSLLPGGRALADPRGGKVVLATAIDGVSDIDVIYRLPTSGAPVLLANENSAGGGKFVTPRPVGISSNGSVAITSFTGPFVDQRELWLMDASGAPTLLYDPVSSFTTPTGSQWSMPSGEVFINSIDQVAFLVSLRTGTSTTFSLAVHDPVAGLQVLFTSGGLLTRRDGSVAAGTIASIGGISDIGTVFLNVQFWNNGTSEDAVYAFTVPSASTASALAIGLAASVRRRRSTAHLA